MGRFNNYQSDLVYTPQTFEKLAVLPMMLKKRQDDMEAQNDLIGLNIANTKVAAGYQEAYDTKRKEFESKSQNLAQRMASEGAGNPNLIKEFQNLKRQYNKDAAATGILGAGKQRYIDDLEAERLYTQYGVDKSGQNADQVTKKWREKYTKEQDEIKAGLAADPNYIAAPIVHEYAPKAVSVTDFAKQLQNLIGATSTSRTKDTLRDLSSATIKGSDGLLSINTESDMYKSNKNQVQGFVNLMNSNLLDKSSPLNQHLRYNDKDPKEYLDDVQNLAAMMTSSEEAHADKINPIGGGSAGSTSSSQTADDTKEGGVILQERTQRSPDLEIRIPNYNQGQPIKLSGANIKNVMQRMENLEKLGDPIINTKEYATQKQAVIDTKESMDQWDLAHSEEMKESFQKIKPKNDQAFYGAPVVNYANYDDFIKKRKEMRSYIERNFNPIPASPGVNQVTKENVLAGFDDKTNNILQRAREATGKSDLMYAQNIYGFGFNDASAKLVEDSVPYLKNNAQYFIDQAGPNSFAYQRNEDGSEDPIDISTLNATAADEISISSVATKNGKGVPSIGLELKFKGADGEPDVIKRLDLEVTDKSGNIAREAIEKMKSKTADPKTKYVLDSVLDSASANQVIPDSKEYQGSGKNISGASKAQSNMIVTFNAASSTGRNKNTINPKGNYQLLSQGPHYALKVRQPGDADYHVYNINDLLYDRIPKGNSTTDRQKQDAKNKEVAAIYALMGYDPEVGISSFSKGVNPIAPEDNGDKRNRLSLALNDYVYAFNKAGATQQERDDATNLFIERTKDVGLKSMNKAAFLKH
jgi:hypothetical protein